MTKTDTPSGYTPLYADTPVHPLWVSPCCGAQCWNTCGEDNPPAWLLPTWWSCCGKCGEPCDPVKR